MSNKPITPPWPNQDCLERFTLGTMHPAELQIILSEAGQQAVLSGTWDTFWAEHGNGIPREVDPNAVGGPPQVGFPQADPAQQAQPGGVPQGFYPQQGQQPVQGRPGPQVGARPTPIPRPVREPVTPAVETPREPSIEEAIQLMGVSAAVMIQWIQENTWEGCTLQLTLGHGGLQVLMTDIPPEGTGEPEVITGIEGEIDLGREGEAIFQVLSRAKQHVEMEMRRLQAAQQAQAQQPRQPMGRAPSPGPRGPLHRLG